MWVLARRPGRASRRSRGHYAGYQRAPIQGGFWKRRSCSRMANVCACCRSPIWDCVISSFLQSRTFSGDRVNDQLQSAAAARRQGRAAGGGSFSGSTSCKLPVRNRPVLPTATTLPNGRSWGALRSSGMSGNGSWRARFRQLAGKPPRSCEGRDGGCRGRRGGRCRIGRGCRSCRDNGAPTLAPPEHPSQYQTGSRRSSPDASSHDESPHCARQVAWDPVGAKTCQDRL